LPSWGRDPEESVGCPKEPDDPAIGDNPGGSSDIMIPLLRQIAK
jgi:hypothetical protein